VTSEDVERVVALRRRQHWLWLWLLYLPVAFGVLEWLGAFGPLDTSTIYTAMAVSVSGNSLVSVPLATKRRIRTAPIVRRRLRDLAPAWARWAPLAIFAPWVAVPLLFEVSVEDFTPWLWLPALSAFNLLAHPCFQRHFLRQPLHGEDEDAVRVERALRSSAISFTAGVTTAFLPVQLAGLCWASAGGPGITSLDIAGAGFAALAAVLPALLLLMPFDWQLPADLRNNRVSVA
jgi:hypothetical protein